MGTVAIGTWDEWTFGGRDTTIKCPGPIFPKCLQMGTGGRMNTWGEWIFGGKGYPKCHEVIFPKCLQMGTWDKFTFGGKSVPQVP